jgi:hypothetical protein
MFVHKSGRRHRGHSSVGACPYRLAVLPLYNCPYTNLRRDVSSFGLVRSRAWSDAPVCAFRAPVVFACRMSLLYREVWCMLRSVASLTFWRSCIEGRVNACIWRRPASGIVHHGERRVACLGPVARIGGGVVGLAVYMTQNGGRGAMDPISTRRVCSLGKVSYSVTASLAVASARSFPRICMCALIFRMTVE